MPDLIRTKIQTPLVPENHIARPVLFERLGAVHDPALVLVSAPAGFGKSTTISAWGQTLEQATAWFALDAGDNDPARFWSYVLAAIRSVGVELSAGVSQTISAGSEAVATALINALVERATPLTLVLDDYHIITERSIHDAVALLLDHMPAGVTLVMITRADPPFPLGRLRARGQMVELRAADLRFTSNEVQAFLQSTMALMLNAEEITVLEARTEGWPAGLQLAALALRGHTDPAAFVTDFAGSHHYIVEYLTEEVIHQQPGDVQRFLLETAHLKRLSVSLCNAVTGRDDADHMLRHLQENNLFLLALDPSQTWYRYHHLFADLLRHRQQRHADAALVMTLHERASDWYRTEGQISEAVEYALAGHVHQKAARLLEDNWHHLQHRGELHTVRRWLDALPQHLVATSAPLSMAYCWLHHLSSESDAIRARLADVRKAWEQHEANQTVPDREAWIVIPPLARTVAAIVALQDGDAQAALELAHEALELVPADPRVNRDLLVGSATYRLAQAYQELEQFEDAIDIMLKVLVQLKRTGNIIGLVRGVSDTVRLYLAIRQPDEAQTICDDTLAHLNEQGYARSPLVGMVHVARAEIALFTGDHDLAQTCLDEVLAGSHHYPLLMARFEAVQSRLARAADRTSALSEPLTEREMDVLRLLSAGYSNQQIANELVVTEDTVKRHNTHIYGKLDVTNRTQAVLRAQELGLL